MTERAGRPIPPWKRPDDGRTLDQLVHALRTGAAEDRLRAAEALGRYGRKAAVEEAIARARSATPAEFTEAATAILMAQLTFSAAAPAVPGLVDALADPEARVRAAAAEALSNIRAPAAPATSALVRALADDPDPEVRLSSAKALAHVEGDPAVCVPALVRTLGDPSEALRSRAAYALGRIGLAAAAAVPALVEALQDGGPSLRDRAAFALGGVGAAAATALPLLVARLRDEAVHEVRATIAGALERLGPLASPAVDAIVLATEDPHWTVRMAAARALGTIGSVGLQGVPRLLACLVEPEWAFRRAAVVSLGQLEAREALPALRAHREPDARVRAALEVVIQRLEGSPGG